MKDIDILKTLNVLYVEDEKDAQEELVYSIRDFFKSLTVANNGLEGFEAFKADSNIDMIITDIKMPKLSGLEMIERIRKESNIPIVITTAFNDSKFLLDSIKLGVDGYLSKPITIKELLKIISKASIKIVKTRLQKELEETNKEIELKNKKLFELNRDLEAKVEKKVNELREKDKIMLRQSKQAIMGEIIDAVAHQWKQPLATIDLLALTLKRKLERHNKISKEYCDEKSTQIREQVKHLIDTLAEFRSFFRSDKKIDIFSIEESVQSSLVLIKDEYAKELIKVEYSESESFKVKGFFNEFKHVLLNIMNNAKDAFIDNEIKNRTIQIEAKRVDNRINIAIKDNAGGIPDAILNKIFEPNFTTKEKKGTGIGLYICKMILDKVDGKLSVKNRYEDEKKIGARFDIFLDLEDI